jgi:hyperosmotically inducible periplasmic protein
MQKSFMFQTAAILIAICGASGFDKSPTDVGLAKEVRHELVMLPYYSVFDDLAFRVNGGVVTLLGEVTRPTLKDDAERVVKKDRGCREGRQQH